MSFKMLYLYFSTKYHEAKSYNMQISTQISKFQKNTKASILIQIQILNEFFNKYKYTLIL